LREKDPIPIGVHFFLLTFLIIPLIFDAHARQLLQWILSLDNQMVVEEITRFAMNNGYDVKNLDFSPITGGEGNIEFLLLSSNFSHHSANF
jgi:hypothetical protein